MHWLNYYSLIRADILFCIIYTSARVKYSGFTYEEYCLIYQATRGVKHIGLFVNDISH